MTDKFVNFRANEVKGTLGDPEAGLKAAKMMRATAKPGKTVMGGLPPKPDEQDAAIQKIAREEFKQRVEASESEKSGS